jgi:alpha-N-arabinofuranosidase
MITTNVGNGGNFMVTAQSPSGPWSEPIWLEQQGIDPSLLFDGDKCYMVSNPDNMITLCEIDPSTGRQLTQSRGIWQGTGGRYPEGPHLYKKDGYYYLLISEGGTELAHSITIARSRNIYGPYEANPDNPILTHCNLKGQTNIIQGTGHGDLVQATDGSWWITFLGFRFYNGSYHHLGRETFLAPVEWPEGGWPVVNGGEPIQMNERQPITVRTDFEKPLGSEWVFLQNPDSSNYKLEEGHLRLKCSDSDLRTNQQPTFIGRRQERTTFSFETKIMRIELSEGAEAGICAYQMHEGYVQAFVSNSGGNYINLSLNLKNVNVLLAKEEIGQARHVWLRMSSDGQNYQFAWSTDGLQYSALGLVDCTMLSTETVGGFTGVTLGLYAYGGSQSGYADFDYVEYREY